MADSDERGRAGRSSGSRRSRDSSTTRRSAPKSKRKAAAPPEPEAVPEKERLERLRSVLERKSKFG